MLERQTINRAKSRYASGEYRIQPRDDCLVSEALYRVRGRYLSLEEVQALVPAVKHLAAVLDRLQADGVVRLVPAAGGFTYVS